jgi:hypothetical protein
MHLVGAGTDNAAGVFPAVARDRRLATDCLSPLPVGHSLPVLGFDSVRFLLLLGEARWPLLLRPHCAGVNYVRINAES